MAEHSEPKRTKLLQIIHVSDLHWSKESTAEGRAQLRFLDAGDLLSATPLVKRMSEMAKNFANKFREHFIKGLRGHCPMAFEFFERALDQELDSGPDTSPEWPETLLVVTGDLSTWGDEESIKAALGEIKTRTNHAYMKEFQKGGETSFSNPLVIYGNHDVWAGSIPLLSSQSKLDAHRTRLHSHPNFHHDWPIQLYEFAPGEHALDAPAPLIAVWTLNTVLHNPVLNTLALGDVKEDRYWEPTPGRDQLEQLLREARTRRQFRIVLTHHPVAGEEHWPGILCNASDVATALQQCTDPGKPSWPLAHLILSGHTHHVFPPIGELHSGLVGSGVENPPQLQLTIGTLSQAGHERRTGARGRAAKKPPPERQKRGKQEEQCWQLLRFYSEEPLEGFDYRLVIERIVYYHGAGSSGEFTPRALSSDPEDIAESVTLDL